MAVDLDNTCALEDFPLVGAYVPYAVESLKRLVSNGVKTHTTERFIPSLIGGHWKKH